MRWRLRLVTRPPKQRTLKFVEDAVGNILDKTDHVLPPEPKSRQEAYYQWARPSEPGTFKWVAKAMINLEGRYQREATSEARVQAIARHLDWRRFGVILVVERSDGTLWAIDGGHRLRATFYRQDILEVPCFIFRASENGEDSIEDSLREEARAFTDIGRTHIKDGVYGAHRSGLTAENEIDLIANRIYVKAGYKISRSGGRAAKVSGLFHAIGSLKWTVAQDKTLGDEVPLSERCFLAAADIAQGDKIPGDVIRGLFTLAQRMAEKGIDVLKPPYITALTNAGIDGLHRSIQSEKYDTMTTGTVADARGVLRILNKKRKRKLTWADNAQK